MIEAVQIGQSGERVPILAKGSNATGDHSQEGKSEASSVGDMQHHTTDLASDERLTLTKAERLEGHPCLVPDNELSGLCVGRR